MNDIYEAPQSDLGSRQQTEPKPIRAVIYATLLDILGTIVYGVVITFGYGMYLGANGFSPEEVNTILMDVSPYSLFGLVATLGGLTISFFASRYCTKKAGEKYVPATITFAVLVVSSGFAMSYSAYSLLENILFAVLTIITIASSSYLYVRQRSFP